MKLELGVSAVILAVYVVTLSPSIAGGDSGELVAEGCILGVAHPPGYPLFTMMVNAISRLVQHGHGSFGDDVAYLVNMSSALLTAGAAFFIGRIIRILTTPTHVAAPLTDTPPGQDAGVVFGMGMFAFSPLIWQYAVTAEVFPLNTFFVAWILHLVLCFARDGTDGTAVLGALVCGLAFTNQHTILLYEFPLIIFMLLVLYRRLLARPVLAVAIGVAFLAGFSLYAYMPLAQTRKPEDGSWGDVTTFAGFVHHFLRRDYGTLQLFSGEAGRETEDMPARNWAYLVDVTMVQGLHVSTALALVAIVSCRSIAVVVCDATAASPSSSEEASSLNDGLRRAAPLALVATQLFYFLVFHSLANLPLSNRLHFGIHQRFWMQPNVLFFAWAGVGLATVLRALAGWGGGSGSSMPAAASSLQAKQRALQAAADDQRKGNKGGKHGTKKITATSVAADSSTDDKGASASRSTRGAYYYFGLAVAAAAVWIQHSKWRSVSDQSNNTFFNNYASALLAPLPPDAVYLINYDQQWTSVRYMQKCQSFRPDVTSINLSMMTYSWFQQKHSLYPDLVMPAGHLGKADVGDRTFSISSFVRANEGHKHIYMSGKLSHADPAFERHYDTVPHGLTSALVRRDQPLSARAYRDTTVHAWRQVLSELSTLPPEDQYPEETWEWTICRDFKDRVAETAAFLLEVAIKEQDSDPLILLDAMYWMEATLALERGVTGKGYVPWSVAKNAGLVHLHIAKSQQLGPALARLQVRNPGALPYPQDVFGLAPAIGWPGYDDDGLPMRAVVTSELGEEPTDAQRAELTDSQWRSWSAARFAHHWSTFVADADARENAPEYPTIKKMLNTVLSKK